MASSESTATIFEKDVAPALQHMLGLSSFSSAMFLQFLVAKPAAAATSDSDDDLSSSTGKGSKGRPLDTLAFPHVIPWLLELAACVAEEGKEKPSLPASVLRPSHPYQRGCPEVLPGLRAEPVWYHPSMHAEVPSSLSFLHELQEQWQAVRDEVLHLRGSQVFQPYMAPSWAAKGGGGGGGGEAAGAHASAGAPAADGPPPAPHNSSSLRQGSWNVFYLQLHNLDTEENKKLAPVMTQLLKRVPRLYEHSLVSALAPGTHIQTHTGPTNKKLRVHLPLLVPDAEGAGGASAAAPSSNPAAAGAPTALPLTGLRAGPNVLPFIAGQPLVFDDSFQHEAWNNSASQSRIVLILDIWHPDLTDREVKALGFLRNCQMRAAKALSEAGRLPEGADFYSILDKGRREAGDRDGQVFAGVPGQGSTGSRQAAPAAALLPSTAAGESLGQGDASSAAAGGSSDSCAPHSMEQQQQQQQQQQAVQLTLEPLMGVVPVKDD